MQPFLTAEELNQPFKLQNLTILRLARNQFCQERQLLLKQNAIYPGLPTENYEFALQFKEQLKKQRQNPDAEGEKLPERSTILLGLNQTQTRPFPPPKVANKGKAPELPRERKLHERLPAGKQIENIGLEEVDLTEQLLQRLFELFKMLIEVDLSWNAI